MTDTVKTVRAFLGFNVPVCNEILCDLEDIEQIAVRFIFMQVVVCQ